MSNSLSNKNKKTQIQKDPEKDPKTEFYGFHMKINRLMSVWYFMQYGKEIYTTYTTKWHNQKEGGARKGLLA